MLIDSATIRVRSGRGGDGSNSLRREKYIPKGGPDGGDGGNGGDVILRGDQHVDTLLEFAHKRRFAAGDAENGRGRNQHGANGADLEIPVPLGCLVYDEETGELVADVVEHDQRVVVAKGGRGGRGNEHFKTPTHQTPREFEEGGEPVERVLRFELKLIADVGLVGLPNAGKSTFLAAISRARPKVADYPFTTLMPQLGIADLPGDRRLVVADIPGLIEGAAEGAGLGHDFLRHIERTKVLVHLVDCAPPDGSDPIENWRTIRGELADFDVDLADEPLADKPEVLVLNKIELLDEAARAELRERAMRETRRGPEGVLLASGATGEGVRAVLEAAWTLAGKGEPAGWGEPG